MSRLAKVPLALPQGVEATISDNTISVSGKKGKFSVNIHELIKVEQKENSLFVKAKEESNGADDCKNTGRDKKNSSAMLGTTYRLIHNAIKGVSEGFSKKLLINGVGYKAQVSGKTLNLNLGYSHPINYSIPEGIELKINSPTDIDVIGIDKQLVGQVAAVIRSYRKPEPYQGKGIKYSDEYIFRKETKKKK